MAVAVAVAAGVAVGDGCWRWAMGAGGEVDGGMRGMNGVDEGPRRGVTFTG